MTETHFDPDTLANHLDEILPPGHDGVSVETDDALLNAALTLANAPHPELSSKALASIQKQMLAVQSQNQITQQRQMFRSAWRVLAAVASTVLVFILISPAAASSVPGDALYPVKRAFEQVELATAGILRDEVVVRLRHAEHRAREAVTLVESQRFSADLIEEALENMTAAAQVAARGEAPTPLNQVFGQTVQINALLDYVIAEAEERHLASDPELVTISNTLQAARQAGNLLLPTSTPTVTPTATNVPTSTMEPTAEPSSTPTLTQTATLTLTPSMTPSPEAPAAQDVPQPSVTPGNQPETPTRTMPVNAYARGSGNINVRSGPGLEFAIIAVLRPGQRVEGIGITDDDTWLNVRLMNGAEGWIATFLVSVGSPPAEAGNTGDRGGAGSPGDFGCDGQGNACNAPGQGQEQGGPPESPPGQGQGQGGPPADRPGQGQGGPPQNPPGQGGSPPGRPGG